VAFDGDADRCLAVDADGVPLDGDQLILILALAMRAQGRLPDSTVVTTVMSNLGFAQALEREGLTLKRAAVGDRHVLEAMLEGGHQLGGEQSGHFIVADRATTGDGILAALELLADVNRSGQTLAHLGALMTRMPQILINCRVSDRSVATSPVLAEAVTRAELRLGDAGRVLVRPSGTEPLIRVMVEAATQAEADAVAEELAAVVRTL
jgi:phosphoglucosamine mutase